MDIDQIKDLMNYLEKSKLKRLKIKKKDFELEVEKEGQNVPPPPRVVPTESESAFYSDVALQGIRGGSRGDAPGTYVKSPMVGTFYSSPSPDQPAFVKVGDRVDENTVVCIVEAMKVMNEVKASASGIVAEILVDNAEPVEFGTRLLRIE